MNLPKTAQWIVTITTHDDPPDTSTFLHWLRLDPPALAWWSHRGDQHVIDERGHLITNSSMKECLLFPHRSDWNRDRLLSDILPAGRSGLPDLNSAGVTASGWSMDPTVFQGRPAARYRKRYPEGDFMVEETKWLDPSSGLLLRSERSEFDGRTGRLLMETVEHDHRYDVESPDGVFDLPPPGKPLVALEANDVFQNITETLSPEERAQIEGAIAQSNEAWVQGDFAEFSRAWYFRRSRARSALPSRTDWRRWVLENAGLWKRWNASIVSIDRTDHIGVATGATTIQLVTAPGTLRVATTLHVEWGDQGKTWEGKTTYYVQKRSDGYRIVHWEYPSAELQALR